MDALGLICFAAPLAILPVAIIVAAQFAKPPQGQTWRADDAVDYGGSDCCVEESEAVTSDDIPCFAEGPEDCE